MSSFSYWLIEQLFLYFFHDVGFSLLSYVVPFTEIFSKQLYIIALIYVNMLNLLPCIQTNYRLKIDHKQQQKQQKLFLTQMLQLFVKQSTNFQAGSFYLTHEKYQLQSKSYCFNSLSDCSCFT
ncbi:hypothetical protein FGO68_gene11628 [Halteria grandinella]|uniref:Transmembrane protein n=1 Tax=Halteria grandinella TaxID=5974 RepID=A0A8J8N9N1_HALGN|nr:hypothetical protein FGO68_gene11628 [Halteria grandinella]